MIYTIETFAKFAAAAGEISREVDKAHFSKDQCEEPADGMHHICCTRLWTACTRLILREIKERVFY